MGLIAITTLGRVRAQVPGSWIGLQLWPEEVACMPIVGGILLRENGKEGKVDLISSSL